MTDELKPCTHCGNAEIKPMHVCNSNKPLYRVKCYKCGMQTHLDDKDKVIAAWNTRHTPCDLSSIDNISLMAESVRRGLATVEPDTLPQWAIEAIKTRIEKCRSEQDKYNRVGPCLERGVWYNRIEALKWVLALRKPEEK